jgi:hypothetical protein
MTDTPVLFLEERSLALTVSDVKRGATCMELKMFAFEF